MDEDFITSKGKDVCYCTERGGGGGGVLYEKKSIKDLFGCFLNTFSHMDHTHNLTHEHILI